jgi:hypothetical protein
VAKGGRQSARKAFCPSSATGDKVKAALAHGLKLTGIDLGLDPAGKQARKMIDRVDKRLVFKPLNMRRSSR